MGTNNNPWKKLGSRIAYKNPWITVREDRVMGLDGKETIYGVIEQPDPVYIVPLTEKGEIVLVKQFRYTTQMFSLEIPAGGSDGDESLIAAKRELWEETGFKAEKWLPLGLIQVRNGIASDMGHIFLAEGLTQTFSDKKHEDGIIEVRPIEYKKVLEMIKSGEISDCQTITALMCYDLSTR